MTGLRDYPPRLVTISGEGVANSNTYPNRATFSGGDGGGIFDPMEARVTALEEGMKEIKTSLKEIRDGQQAAALEAVKQTAALSVSLAEIGTKFAEVKGRLDTSAETATGLRRDVEKLPDKWGVALILIAVIGGLGVTAGLLKTVWPVISRLISP